MAGNSNLQQANKAKQDEFYTQLTDIKNELRHYKKQYGCTPSAFKQAYNCNRTDQTAVGEILTARVTQ